MSLKTKLSRLISLIFAVITAGLFVSSAQAQEQCKHIFTKTSIYGKALGKYKLYEEFTKGLLDVVTDIPEMITAAEVQLATAASEKQLEGYFRSAGIDFKKVPSSIQIKGLSGQNEPYTLNHFVYQLTGTKNGDEMSRLLYGIQSNERLNGKDLKIEYDSYFSLKNAPGTAAKMLPLNSTIYIGHLAAASDFVGLTVLHHEIQHYISQVKIMKGEMSLARLQLSSQIDTESWYYAGFFAADEMETWLRDLRILTSKEHNQAKDKKMRELLPAKMLEEYNINALRAQRTEAAFTTLDKLIQNSKATLASLSNPENILVIGPMPAENRTSLGVVLSTSTYKGLEIDLTGLMTPEEVKTDRKKLALTINQITNWSKTRIDQIEQEVIRIKNRPK